jgi:hypothetical protein
MPNYKHRVIKSGDVMLAGRRPIGSAAEGASARPSQAAARIVAQDASGATMEVVCSCGKRSYVRCAYRRSPSQPGQVPTGQAPTGQAGQSAATPNSQEKPL